MFGRMMNNYYYGKSGKGDFRKEDMPSTRSQLFKDTLRTRFASLIRLNLIYMLIWLPAMVMIFINFGNIYNDLANYDRVQRYSYEEFKQQEIDAGHEFTMEEADYVKLKNEKTDIASYVYSSVFYMLLYLFPCIAITGPATAGVSYVTRNWARDEHAFIWSDFKDAVKANWKIPLVISSITGLLPLAAYQGWITYGEMSKNNVILVVPQVLVVMVLFIWSISVTYMYPLTVTYDLKLKDVIRNGLLLGVARLPFSIGIRLLHFVPFLIYIAATFFFGMDPMLALVILGVYYVLVGYALSRFVSASYTNAVFDRFINPRIAGAKVNQGMRETEDDDEDDEEEEYSEEAEK